MRREIFFVILLGFYIPFGVSRAEEPIQPSSGGSVGAEPVKVAEGVPTGVAKETIGQPLKEEKAPEAVAQAPGSANDKGTAGSAALLVIPGINSAAKQAAPSAPEKPRGLAENDACRLSPMKVASLVIPSPSADLIQIASGKPRRLISYNLNLPCPATVTLTAQIDYQLVHCWNEFIGPMSTRSCRGTGANGQMQVRNLTYTALGFAPKDKLIQDGFFNGVMREASTKLFVNVSNTADTFPRPIFATATASLSCLLRSFTPATSLQAITKSHSTSTQTVLEMEIPCVRDSFP